jgi:hypothetical protein
MKWVEFALWLRSCALPWTRRKRDIRFYHVLPLFVYNCVLYCALDYVEIGDPHGFAGVWGTSEMNTLKSLPYRMYCKEPH